MAGAPTADYARWWIRRRVRALRRAPISVWHELQWMASTRGQIDVWTERRLQLGDAFWLFILGLNNSGTSLLSHLLSQHADIRRLPSAGQGLSKAIPRASAHGVSRRWTSRPSVFRWTEDSDPTAARRLRYDWARYYPKRPGILLEKSPPNTLRSRWLQRHFRPSRFIAIVRSPYAVCEGMRRREGIPIAEAAQHWRRGHEWLLEDLPRLDHVLHVSYEQLCDAPETELKRLQQFLSLTTPFDRSILDPALPTHNVEGRPRHVGNLNAESLARLSDDDIRLIGDLTTPVLTAWGYSRLSPDFAP